MDEDKILDRWVRSSNVGFDGQLCGMDRFEILELLLMEHPAPLSDELTKLWTLPPSESCELLTDSMLDMADEHDSLSPLKFRKNLL